MAWPCSTLFGLNGNTLGLAVVVLCRLKGHRLSTSPRDPVDDVVPPRCPSQNPSQQQNTVDKKDHSIDRICQKSKLNVCDTICMCLTTSSFSLLILGSRLVKQVWHKPCQIYTKTKGKMETTLGWYNTARPPVVPLVLRCPHTFCVLICGTK